MCENARLREALVALARIADRPFPAASAARARADEWPEVRAAAWLAERDGLAARVRELESALERVTHNFRLAVQGKPVRDMAETLAEVDAALAAGERETPS